MSYVTRKQADREISRMMDNCKKIGALSYHFPKFNNLSIKLKEGITIKEWVTRYIEDRNNIPRIEQVSNIKK